MKKLGLQEETPVMKSEYEQVSESDADVDEFIVLARNLNDFAAFVLSQKKLKHCMFEKNDLVAVVSTFVQVVENRLVDYFYSYQVTINSAIDKNKILKKKFSEANKLIDMIIKGDVQ